MFLQNFRWALIFITLHACYAWPSTYVVNNIVPYHQFFYELKSSNKFVHSQLPSYWLPDRTDFYNQITHPGMHKNIIVAAEMIQIASGVKSSQTIWQFTRNEWNEQIGNLFQIIAKSAQRLGFRITLSRYDLFHGHIFAIHDANGVLEDVGILFHAKEYPHDLNLGNEDAKKSSPFSYKDFEYPFRNLIWLASTGIIYDVDGNSSSIYPNYFLPKEINLNDPIIQDIISLYLQARTFFLENLSRQVEFLGDVNYFKTNGAPVIFFTY